MEMICLARTQNFPKTNISLSPLDTHTYVYVSEGKKDQFFGKFCLHTKRMIPYGERIHSSRISHSQMFFKIGILEKVPKIHRKTPVQDSLFK